jgi:outer membrane protein assembly complex protein YaeT
MVGRRCARLAFSALFFTTLCGAAWALASEGLNPARTYHVNKIIFAGNHHFSDAQLEAVMQTKTRPFYQFWKARPVFDSETFKADLERLKRLYQQDGYYRVQIDDRVAPRGDLVSPEITIGEGARVQVRNLEVTVNQAPRPTELNAQFTLPLAQGDPFVESKYQRSEQRLMNFYQRRGYPFARVTRSAKVYVASRSVDVRYSVDPGEKARFGPTSISGLQKVAPYIVRRELTYMQGEPFDASKLAASRQKLLALNLFSSVEFAPQQDSVDPSIAPIELRLREKPPRQVNLSLGYNTQTQLNASLQWSHYNFLGGGRQLLLEATYSDITSYLDAKLIQPYFLTDYTRGILEALQEQETYQTYSLNASRFLPRVDFLITPQMTLTLGWRLEYLRFETLNPQTIAAEGGVRRDGILSGPSMSLIYNTTDDPLDPRRGVSVSLLSNIAAHQFGSDYHYWRTQGEVRHYQSLPWKTIFASRFKLGLANTYGPVPDIPLSERFYSGGEGSVRGYGLRRIGPLSPANEPLGGLSLFEGSVELRHALFWRLAGAAFFDCGQVSVHPYRIPVGNLQCGYGPAVSMGTPVGPVRLDLGFPTKRPRGDASWQIYFSIGQFY